MPWEWRHLVGRVERVEGVEVVGVRKARSAKESKGWQQVGCRVASRRPRVLQSTVDCDKDCDSGLPFFFVGLTQELARASYTRHEMQHVNTEFR
jgi:hypothetical protein